MVELTELVDYGRDFNQTMVGFEAHFNKLLDHIVNHVLITLYNSLKILLINF